MKSAGPQLSITVVLLCSIASLSSNVLTVSCDPDTTVSIDYCSPQTYDPNSAYGAEIDRGLEELTYGTDSRPQYQYRLTGYYAAGFAYCQLRLSPDDCVVCLEAANEYLRSTCQYSVDAYVVMVDCGMRYWSQNVPSPTPSPDPSDA